MSSEVDPTQDVSKLIHMVFWEQPGARKSYITIHERHGNNTLLFANNALLFANRGNWGQMTLPLDLEAGMFTNRRLSETKDLSLERHIRGREHMGSLLCLLAREGEQQKQGHYYTTP